MASFRTCRLPSVNLDGLVASVSRGRASELGLRRVFFGLLFFFFLSFRNFSIFFLFFFLLPPIYFPHLISELIFVLSSRSAIQQVLALEGPV